MKFFPAFISVSFLLVAGNHFCLAQCNPSKPKNLFVTNETGCTAILHWKQVSNAAYYKVRYRPVTGGNWQGYLTTTDTFFLFTALTPNIKYTFGVATFCSAGSSSGYKKINQQGDPCDPPQQVNATHNGLSISFSWINCGASSFNRLRYRNIFSPQWNNVNTGTATSASVTVADYHPIVFQVCACTDTSNNWSLRDTLFLSPAPLSFHPNFIIVVLDD